MTPAVRVVEPWMTEGTPATMSTDSHALLSKGRTAGLRRRMPLRVVSALPPRILAKVEKFDAVPREMLGE
jgi:hypothetical protein